MVDSLDKQMQNEKELIRLAAGVVWGGFKYLCGDYPPDLTGEINGEKSFRRAPPFSL